MGGNSPWLDTVFEHLPEGLVVQAADGEILDSNAAAERILGLSGEQIAGRTSMDPRWAAIHPDGSPFPGHQHPAMVTLATGEPVHGEIMGVRRPHGSLVWLMINSVPLPHTEPTDAAVVVTFADITVERQRAARQLTATVESMIDPHILIRTVRSSDQPHQAFVLDANDAAAVELAREREQLLGASVAQAFGEPAAAEVLTWLLDVIETGEPLVLDEVTVPGDGSRSWDVRALKVGDYVSFTWRDVTQRRATAERLAVSEELFRGAMQSAVTGIAINDLDGRVLEVNDALCAILGRDRASLLASSLTDLMSLNLLHSIERERALLLEDPDRQSVLQGEVHLPGGSSLWARVGTALIRDSEAEPQAFITHFEDVTGEREARETLAFQAFHDPLTGLRNRAWLLDMLELELANATRGLSRVGVLFIDLDNFKVVNDSLGHEAGDEILVAVAERIKSVVRPTDFLGRFGGDEFVVVVTDLEQLDLLDTIAAHIIRVIAAETMVKSHRIRMSASIGIAVSHGDSTPGSLLRDADVALFQAKGSGRARWQLFDDTMHTRALSRMTLESQIRDGLENHEFTVHYQPVVDLATREVTGYEALARWVHPVRGLIAAKDFIPVAEDSGLIIALGERVQKWVVADMKAYPQIRYMGLNVSAVQLASPDWAAGLLATLDAYGVNPRRLVLEVTETSILPLLEPVVRSLEELSAHGMEVFIDDFGTGFSSIAMIQKLPVRGLKLDRSFVMDLTPESTEPNALSAGLAGLARALNLISIAEGVETEEQAELLTSQGWTHGQGYLFGRPGPLGVAGD